MPAIEFRLLIDNFAFEDTVDIIPTSENSQFPASNLRTYFRSKVWRSDGYFEIKLGVNDKINFKESGIGSELTATLTPGGYSATSLATEIKTQLEASGAETYTVSLSSTTGKWTISSGGAFFSILWLTGTDTATSVGSSIGFDITQDNTGATSYTGSKIAIHTVERVVFDIKTSDAIDSIAMLFDSEQDIGFTEQAVIKFKASQTNVWDSPAVDLTLTINNDLKVITHFFNTDQEYRYFAFEITDPENPNLYVQIPMIFLNKAITLGQAPDSGFGYKVEDQSRIQTTPFGHKYADIFPIRRGYEFEFKIVKDEDREALQQAYEQVGETKPFAVSLDPQGNLLNEERFFMYGNFVGDMTSKQLFLGNFELAVNFEERF